MTDGVRVTLRAEQDLIDLAVDGIGVKIYLCDGRPVRICIDVDIPKSLGSNTASELMELLMKQGFEKKFNTMRKCIKVIE